MCLHPISPKVSTLRRNFFLAKNYFHPLIQEKEEPRKKAEWKNLMQCKKYLAVVIPVQFPLPLPFSLKEKENEEGNKRNGMSSTITCRAAIAMHSRNCGRTCYVYTSRKIPVFTHTGNGRSDRGGGSPAFFCQKDDVQQAYECGSIKRRAGRKREKREE